MKDTKDGWDKLDIVLKALVPLLVGALLLIWNSQRTSQMSATSMTEIAVNILAVPPNEEQSGALRNWAIDVLSNPGNPPNLTPDAAEALRTERLPSTWKLYKEGYFSMQELNAGVDKDIEQLEVPTE